MPSDPPSHDSKELPDGDRKSERRRDPRKKLRVLVKFEIGNLFEGFTHNVSLSGIFVMADPSLLKNQITVGKEIQFFLEYDLDNMIDFYGEIVRLQEGTPPAPSGFGVHITRITPDNKLFLSQMILNL